MFVRKSKPENKISELSKAEILRVMNCYNDILVLTGTLCLTNEMILGIHTMLEIFISYPFSSEEGSILLFCLGGIFDKSNHEINNINLTNNAILNQRSNWGDLIALLIEKLNENNISPIALIRITVATVRLSNRGLINDNNHLRKISLFLSERVCNLSGEMNEKEYASMFLNARNLLTDGVNIEYTLDAKKRIIAILTSNLKHFKTLFDKRPSMYEELIIGLCAHLSNDILSLATELVCASLEGISQNENLTLHNITRLFELFSHSEATLKNPRIVALLEMIASNVDFDSSMTDGKIDMLLALRDRISEENAKFNPPMHLNRNGFFENGGGGGGGEEGHEIPLTPTATRPTVASSTRSPAK